ncbi:SCAN domain-containing protein 3 [Thelohanellus kitauei]|uniref:SCAN domain-containing protein 3 n=1 Tax=Thelohanellus kitauei TaxID=669202 RepID=A0A0C2MVA1_THEKT|nr:SCAN domain-containing protein 3 [Thelohanellus kitauei]
MTCRSSALEPLIKIVASHIVSTDCMIHRQTLAAKGMNEDFAHAFSAYIKIVDFIEVRTLNQRLFENMCLEMEAEQKYLLPHTEVRCLSRGRVMQGVYELREELYFFSKSA